MRDRPCVAALLAVVLLALLGARATTFLDALAAPDPELAWLLLATTAAPTTATAIRRIATQPNLRRVARGPPCHQGSVSSDSSLR